MTSGLSSTDLELALSVVVITVLTLLAFRLGQGVHLRSRRNESCVLVGAISFAFLLGWSFFGRLVWAETIQASSVLYWSNLTPISLAFTSGLADHTRQLRRRFRPFVTGALMLLAIGYVVMPIARPVIFPLELQDKVVWNHDVCMQSHESSCAPAAAVTLLRQHGIVTTEARLSDACLTSSLGTAPLGLYRGIKSVATDYGYHARVADRDPDRWIQRGQLPNVAIVRFESLSESGPGSRFLGNRYEGHVITILGQTDGGRWLVGDPAVGRLSWSDQELRERFTGEAIFMRR